MNVYLVQHGQARSEAEDAQRPLAEKGRAAVCRVGAYAAQYANVRVTRILHSGKTRARQTAVILGSFLQPPGGVEETDGLDPMADPALWEKRLTDVRDDLMLVGHLPHLSKLASYLICKDQNLKLVDFQMGGIVCLGRDEQGSWSVRWVLTPEVV